MCCSPIRELTPASRFAMHPRSAASQCDMDGNSDSVARFAKYYHRCAELKNLPRASTERMAILARHKALAVSFVQDTTGEILAAGTYLVTPGVFVTCRRSPHSGLLPIRSAAGQSRMPIAIYIGATYCGFRKQAPTFSISVAGTAAMTMRKDCESTTSKRSSANHTRLQR